MKYLIHYEKLRVNRENLFIYEMEAENERRAIEQFWVYVSHPEDFKIIKVEEKENIQ